MLKARITRPDKNAMQSGKAGMKAWVVEFEPETPYFRDGLMGWTGMTDTSRELSLHFPSKEAAVAYCEKNRVAYEVFEPKPRSQIKKAYADNFKYKKPA